MSRRQGIVRPTAVGVNGGSDLPGVDPDTCLLLKSGYNGRVKEIIARKAAT